MFTLLATLASIFAAPVPATVDQLVAYDLALTLWQLRAKSAARRCGTATRADWREIADDVEELKGRDESLRATAIKATGHMRWGEGYEAAIELAHHCGLSYEEWAHAMRADVAALAALTRHGAEVHEGLHGDFRVEFQGRVVAEGRDVGDTARAAVVILDGQNDRAGILAHEVQA